MQAVLAAEMGEFDTRRKVLLRAVRGTGAGAGPGAQAGPWAGQGQGHGAGAGAGAGEVVAARLPRRQMRTRLTQRGTVVNDIFFLTTEIVKDGHVGSTQLSSSFRVCRGAFWGGGGVVQRLGRAAVRQQRLASDEQSTDVCWPVFDVAAAQPALC